MELRKMTSRIVGKGKSARLVPFPKKHEVLELTLDEKTRTATIVYGIRKGR